MFHNKTITKNLLMERAGLKPITLREMYHEEDIIENPIEVTEEDIVAEEEVVTDTPADGNPKIMEFLQEIDSIQELEELYDGLSERMKQISEKSREDAKSMGRLAKRMKR
jgi:hypothetical protein